MPPIYSSAGVSRSTTGSIVRCFSFQGSVKRAKYQAKFTKVSIVSVSRSALPPHFGQVTCFQVG